MIKDKPPQLTEEEKAAGVTLVEVPLDELEVVDVSSRNVERMARGFIMGTQAIGRRREIREVLEAKVTKRIGRKGKYLVDKLFELIEGVSIVERGADGRNVKGIRYYTVPPNLNAIVYALDRVLGKPKQFVESTEEKRGIILVEHVIKNLAMNPYAKNGVGKNNERGAGGNDELPAGEDGGGATGIGSTQERVNERTGAVAI